MIINQYRIDEDISAIAFQNDDDDVRNILILYTLLIQSFACKTNTELELELELELEGNIVELREEARGKESQQLKVEKSKLGSNWR